MKNFASPSFRLRDASFEVRLIYSLFLIFILVGLATIWVFQFQRIGVSYDRVVAYYLGGEIGGVEASAHGDRGGKGASWGV
jgi:hypothetical protein